MPEKQKIKSPTKKTETNAHSSKIWWILGGIVVLLFLRYVFSQNELENYSSLKDSTFTTKSGDDSYLDTSLSFNIDLNNLPQLGVSSKADVFRMFGKNSQRALRYKNSRTKTIAGRTFIYDEILFYEDFLYLTEKGSQGAVGVTTSTPMEHWQVGVFLDQDVVTHFLLLHRVRPTPDEEYVIAPESRDYEIGSEIWPGASQDIKEAGR